jgi:integrase
VLLGTGMRIGEVEQMLTGWLKLEDAVILVPAEATKGKKRRTVFMSDGLAGRLRDWIAAHDLHSTDRVFGILPDRTTCRRHHNEVVETIGQKGYTMHDHRHTHAVTLARKGCPLPVIQKQLGHKKISQTQIYAEFVTEYHDIGKYLNGDGS